jgi:hypothetical protein
MIVDCICLFKDKLIRKCVFIIILPLNEVHWVIRMKVFSEFFILFLTIITTGCSTIFCIIGFLTPGWHFDQYRNLFCDQCPKIPSTFAIMSIILLIICLILLILLIAEIIDQQQVIVMRFIISSLLLIRTTFLFARIPRLDPNRPYIQSDPSVGASFIVKYIGLLSGYIIL